MGIAIHVNRFDRPSAAITSLQADTTSLLAGNTGKRMALTALLMTSATQRMTIDLRTMSFAVQCNAIADHSTAH